MSKIKSSILSLQGILFRKIDSEIKIQINDDYTHITASNISEESFKKLVIITNSPTYKNSYFHLDDINVTLDNDNEPTEIFGLFQIVEKRIEISDLDGFINDQKTHTPFNYGFQDGITIGRLIDILSSLSKITPDTTDRKKKFTIKFTKDY
jgi:hypothetical protein